MIRVFIDASVFFSACFSNEGASFEIFRQSLEGNVQLIISSLALEETGRNLMKKSPEDLPKFQSFAANLAFEVVDPSTEEVLDAARYTELKDAPIVAAAKRARVDYLVSLDRKHLIEAPEVSKRSGLNIILPSQILQILRAKEQEERE